MAYDYEKAKAAYESLTPEQQQQYVDRNKNNATVQQFARDYAREKSQASTTTPTPSYQNQGAGNYVYNEKTGFYENQTDTSKNTTNQGIAPRPETKQETIIKETPTKQEEIVVSTDTENNKTNTLTPLSNDYYQQTSDEALNKIRNNLNQYRQTNPEYFSDYDSFKKNFSYDLRNDEQKNVLDTWYTGYTKGLELSATPTADLYTQYQNGQISINDLENLRVSNPTKYAELTAQINKGNIISAYDDDKGADKMNIQEMAYEMAAQTFKAFMEGGSGASSIFSEYEEKMNDPEMLELSDQCTEYEAEIEQIQDDIASMKKQVEAEYEGTGASRAKINAIIADRTYDLQLQLRTANSNYNKVANQYNNRMKQYQQEYTMKLQEYQLNMQERKAKMDELGFAMDLMNFETNEQKQEREWNYWVKQQQYQNGDINSSDYSTRYKAALKSVENLLSQYEGIPMVRSAEQMAQDVLTAIDNGSNLGAELTKINQQIQQKPEYKYKYNEAYGKGNGLNIKTYKIGDTDYVEFNKELMTADEFNKKYGGAKNKANYNVVSDDVLMTYSEGREHTFGSFMANPKHNDKEYGGQCGAFVNDYLEEIGAGRPFGNEDITTREGWMNRDKDSPKIGTVAVFDYNNYSSDGKNHGHVAIVISRPDKDGNFWVKDSNYGKDGIIQTRKVNIKDASLKGFIDPTLDQNGNKGGATLTTDTNNSNGAATISTVVDGIQRNYEETDIGLYYDRFEGQSPTDAKLKAIGNGDLEKGMQIFKAQVQDFMNKTGADPLQKRRNEEMIKLRGEVQKNKVYTDYNQMKLYFQKIKDNSNNSKATAASDVALLYAYMKINDPTSVVRESEFKTAQDMGSLDKKWRARVVDAVNGKKLTDSQRQEIYDTAAGLMDGATYQYNNLLDEYAGYINYGGDVKQLGNRGEYVTDDYKTMYGNTNNSEEVNEWTINMPTTGGTASTGSSVSTGIINTTTGFNIPMSWSSFS